MKAGCEAGIVNAGGFGISCLLCCYGCLIFRLQGAAPLLCMMKICLKEVIGNDEIMRLWGCYLNQYLIGFVSECSE